MKHPLVILGTGEGAEEVADLAADSGQWEVIGFVEGLDRDRCRQLFLGRPVTWIEDAATLASAGVAVCAVGSTARERFIQQGCAAGLTFGTLVHPSAQVLPSATLAEGVIVSAGVVIGARARIGAHTFVNRGCLIGHHVEIGRCVTLGPGCNIAGKVRIGDRTYLGLGATVVDHLTIGSGCLVGAGALVARDVPDHVQVVGAPARVVRQDAGGA